VSDVQHLLRHAAGGHVSERVEGCTACEVPAPVSSEAGSPARTNGSPGSRTPAPPTGRKCGCGCGADVKRRFLPGHDAKLKSSLLRRARTNDKAAVKKLEELGWGRFL
jgi:hypothetical protein